MRRWIMRQTWRNLLFAHWPLAPAVLRPLIPEVLELDLRDGDAWVAVTPFLITGLRPRGLPPIPGASNFLELNVRTYVRYRERPGVFFFSLDAASLAAVLGARASYHLPYYHAKMVQKQIGAGFEYASHRRGRGKTAELVAHYIPVAEARPPRPGSLERWLVERYCLYAPYRGRLYRADIHHVPWPLQEAKADFEVNTMAEAAGIELPRLNPVCHFAKELDVLVWAPERLL
jgi:uncharacterized protein YqjF (DUF2071 family)